MEATIEQQNLAELNHAKNERWSQDEENASVEQPRDKNINLIKFIAILGAAVIVDVLEIFLPFIFSLILGLPLLAALWMWRVTEARGAKGDPFFQMIISALGEFISGGVIPAWTILVLYVYFSDTKIGKRTVGKIQTIKQIKA